MRGALEPQVHYLLRGLLVFVTLAGKANAHTGGHVAYALREQELVELRVDTHIAGQESVNRRPKRWKQADLW